jgi:tetratricopeptide (TPR) repeat protein
VLPDRVGGQGTAVQEIHNEPFRISFQAIKSKARRKKAWWMKAVFALLALSLLPVAIDQPLLAQDSTSGVSGISVDESEQLFTVLCALDAAGFNADESTLAEMPARLALRADLLKLQGPATEAVRKFYRDHAIGDSGQMLSRYVTFGLTIGPPPRFSFEVPEDALPPEALVLQELQPLLGAFYREANLASRWQKIEPEYENSAGNYRSVVRNTVIKTNAYLREVIRPSSGRQFTVYVEPLVGKRTNFRNLGDHYAVVAGSSEQEAADEIQHAYLHFMLDPLVLKNRDNLQKARPVLEVAARAPQLSDEYRTDLISFEDECLIKAVELRLKHLPAADQEAALKEDDEGGLVMVRPLVTQMLKFEKSDVSMSYYVLDLFNGVDLVAEQKRAQSLKFASSPDAAEATAAQAQPATPAQNLKPEKDQMLEQGDRAIALRDGAGAADIFQRVLTSYPNDAHALYGLAVASVLTGHAEDSKILFSKVVAVASAPAPAGQAADEDDPSFLAWSHVYLGRIGDLEGDRDTAQTEYKQALSVAGAPESARVAAQHGLDSAYAPPAGSARPQP